MRPPSPGGSRSSALTLPPLLEEDPTANDEPLPSDEEPLPVNDDAPPDEDEAPPDEDEAPPSEEDLPSNEDAPTDDATRVLEEPPLELLPPPTELLVPLEPPPRAQRPSTHTAPPTQSRSVSQALDGMSAVQAAARVPANTTKPNRTRMVKAH